MDFYFSTEGDLKIAPNGDVALTPSNWRDDGQQAYVRVKTEPGDWTLYPNLGVDLTRLYGQPQSRETGALGEKLILDALNREGRFAGKQLSVKSVPTGPQTIRFDIYVRSGGRETLSLSVEQDLGV